MDKGGGGKGQGLNIGTKSFNPNAPVFIPSAYIQTPTVHSARKTDKIKSSKSKKIHSKSIPQFASSHVESIPSSKLSQSPPPQPPAQIQTQTKTDASTRPNESWLNTNAPEFIPRQYDPSRLFEGTKGGFHHPYYPYPYPYSYQQPILMTPPIPQHQYTIVSQGNERLDQFCIFQQPYSMCHHSSGSTDIVNSPEKPSATTSNAPLVSTQSDLTDSQLNCIKGDLNSGSDAKEDITDALEQLSVIKSEESIDTGSDLPIQDDKSSQIKLDEQHNMHDVARATESTVDNEADTGAKDPPEEVYDCTFDILNMIAIGANLYSMNLLKKPFKFMDAKITMHDTKKHRDDTRSSRHDNYESKKLSGFFSCERYSEIDFVRPVQEQLPKPSETSWVANQKLQKADDTIALVRKVKGLLNRLTYEKFDIIYTQLIQIGVFTMEHLRLLIDVVFDKAVTQHHFISMYGELCSKIKKDIVIEGEEASDESEKNNIVRRLLLDKCQNSFESNLKPMVIPPDLNEEESFEAEQKYKHRMRGNMMFVGELLKRKILAAKVLIACLDQVMLKRAECIVDGDIDRGNNHLEAMCTLLQTVGKSFDTCKWKHLPDLDKHLESLKVIGKDDRVSFRIRCIIKNVLDSRNDRWEDRGAAKNAEIPCKLEELRSKVQAETEKIDRSRGAKTDRDNRDIHRFGRGVKYERTRVCKTDRGDADAKAAEAEFSMSKDVLKRRLKSIVSELAFSSDVNEANECIAELKIPDSKHKMMLVMLFVGIVENCAKVTMHKERRVVLSWFITIARNSLQHSIDEFLNGHDEEQHNYSYLLEDYPVLPTIMDELFTYIKDSGAVKEQVIANWRDSIKNLSL
ncbi:translation initiation factor eIF-4F [Babesia microti strain RI]|uniref:Translation initiation factor eIF-4F n=1 Tax=Babesia microti (strain RI) TaxID=1133968 RepID=A0A1N6LWG5_BABMR|nr:translation initiation factor eIF-4F [Babesia microti strain RI]SIO73208.1 translation initiation factor eIF-4F [Babesia microti strain RI]|eukprot:XP_021337316.1 translation initiation factor eIF-4F [Babesia microti strain RI]